MAAFAGAHGETVAKNIVQDLMGGAASPYKRVNELLNYLINMIALELPVNSPSEKKIRMYISIAAVCGHVGSLRKKCWSRNVQWLPHPELCGVEAEVRGPVH